MAVTPLARDMHASLFVAVAACAAASLLPIGRARGDETAAAQLVKLERLWSEAEIKHDLAALRRILDDRFICTFGTEKPLDKEEFIKLIAGETMLSQDPSDATI